MSLPDFNPIPTTEDVKEVFDGLKKFSELHMADKPDSLFPIMSIMTVDPLADNKKEIILFAIDTGFSGELEKKKTIKAIAAQLLKKFQKFPIVVGLMTECWISEHKRPEGQSEEDWKDSKYPHLMPSMDPQRKEAVQVSALGFHGPNEDGMVLMDARTVRRVNGTEDEGPMEWGGGWMNPLGGDTKSVECHILERFFRAYMRFVMELEDAEPYLALSETRAITPERV